jgi:hypothetical protein
MPFIGFEKCFFSGNGTHRPQAVGPDEVIVDRQDLHVSEATLGGILPERISPHDVTGAGRGLLGHPDRQAMQDPDADETSGAPHSGCRRLL